MTPDEIIEVLQGVKAGRKWEMFSETKQAWADPVSQETFRLFEILSFNRTVRLAPLPDEITIPARVIPAPLREAPKNRTTVYFADPFLKDFTGSEKWEGSTLQQMWLARGLLHLLKANAIQASKAMRPYA